jgi:hypothetical protein
MVAPMSGCRMVTPTDTAAAAIRTDDDDDSRAPPHPRPHDNRTRIILVTPPARACGSQVRFHPLRIRHAFVLRALKPQDGSNSFKFDQQKRLGTDFASA